MLGRQRTSDSDAVVTIAEWFLGRSRKSQIVLIMLVLLPPFAAMVLAPLLLVIDILQPAILAGEGQAQVRSGLVVALATVVLAAFTLLMWVVAVLTADRA